MSSERGYLPAPSHVFSWAYLLFGLSRGGHVLRKIKLLALAQRLLLGIAGLSAFGCSDPNEPSRSNLTGPLTLAVAEQRKCTPLDVEFPFVESAATRWERFKSFEEVGLVEAKDVIVTAKGGSKPFHQGRKHKAREFSLTAEGTQYFEVIPGASIFGKKRGFCSAKAALVDIHRIEPTSTLVGRRKVVRVDYTFQWVPYEWAKRLPAEAVLSSVGTGTGSAEKLTDSAELILTTAGWKTRRQVVPSDTFVEDATNTSTDSRAGLGGFLDKMLFGN